MGHLINISVGIALDASTPPRVLVARRHAEAVRGGLWEFPGGKVEEGESTEAAVRREFREELGCAIEVLAALPTSSDHDPAQTAEAGVRLHPFVGRIEDSARPEAFAAEELRWVPVADLGALEWPPANRAVIRSLERWIGANRPNR